MKKQKEEPKQCIHDVIPKTGLPIGDYFIGLMPEGSVWIEDPDGEGMSVPTELFEDCIDQFYRENFH